MSIKSHFLIPFIQTTPRKKKYIPNSNSEAHIYIYIYRINISNSTLRLKFEKITVEFPQNISSSCWKSNPKNPRFFLVFPPFFGLGFFFSKSSEKTTWIQIKKNQSLVQILGFTIFAAPSPVRSISERERREREREKQKQAKWPKEVSLVVLELSIFTYLNREKKN